MLPSGAPVNSRLRRNAFLRMDMTSEQPCKSCLSLSGIACSSDAAPLPTLAQAAAPSPEELRLCLVESIMRVCFRDLRREMRCVTHRTSADHISQGQKVFEFRALLAYAWRELPSAGRPNFPIAACWES